MTCIATAPVSRRRAVAPPLQAALAWQAAASSSGVASRPVLFTKDDNSVSVACTYDYMGRRATKSEDVYLWSYGDGGRDFTYGFKREPIIYK